MFERTFSFWRRLVSRGPRPAPPPVPVPDTDRRVWGRFPADVEVLYHPAGVAGETPSYAKVKDISKGGINLLVNRKFETGDLLSIDLPRSGDPATHTVLGCIVRVIPEGGDAWAVGCVFCASCRRTICKASAPGACDIRRQINACDQRSAQ